MVFRVTDIPINVSLNVNVSFERYRYAQNDHVTLHVEDNKALGTPLGVVYMLAGDCL